MIHDGFYEVIAGGLEVKENGKRLDRIINEPVLVLSSEGSVFIGSLRSASSLTSVIIAPLVAPLALLWY